jgi:hypothetical protein
VLYKNWERPRPKVRKNGKKKKEQGTKVDTKGLADVVLLKNEETKLGKSSSRRF